MFDNNLSNTGMCFFAVSTDSKRIGKTAMIK